MVMKLRVEYAYDPESHNWSFRVPSLGIVGGAESREDAEKRVVDAFAKQGVIVANQNSDFLSHAPTQSCAPGKGRSTSILVPWSLIAVAGRDCT